MIDDFKVGDRARVSDPEPGLSRYYGRVGDVVAVERAVWLHFTNSEVPFSPDELTNVTKRPKKEDTRTVGEKIRDDKKKPKKRIRRIT